MVKQDTLTFIVITAINSLSKIFTDVSITHRLFDPTLRYDPQVIITVIETQNQLRNRADLENKNAL